MSKYLGISLAVLGVALAVIPFVSDCASQGKFMAGAMGMQMPMRCYGNRLTELAIGFPLFAVGAVMTLAGTRSKGAFLSLSILAVLLGAAGILMPTQVIGTCPNAVMTCNTVMKPAIISVGSLAIVGGVVGMVITPGLAYLSLKKRTT